MLPVVSLLVGICLILAGCVRVDMLWPPGTVSSQIAPILAGVLGNLGSVFEA